MTRGVCLEKLFSFSCILNALPKAALIEVNDRRRNPSCVDGTPHADGVRNDPTPRRTRPRAQSAARDSARIRTQELG
jgi:hypothetical protein